MTGTCIAVPLAYRPQYQCPHCQQALVYDSTNNDAHESRASCAGCGRVWIVTATAFGPHPELHSGAKFQFTMRAAD